MNLKFEQLANEILNEMTPAGRPGRGFSAVRPQDYDENPNKLQDQRAGLMKKILITPKKGKKKNYEIRGRVVTFEDTEAGMRQAQNAIARLKGQDWVADAEVVNA